jgi:hypothetical protein
MGFKTLCEQFGEPEDIFNSPLDFQKEITVIAVPAPVEGGELGSAPAPGGDEKAGTVLQLPSIPTTSEVQVNPEAGKKFKGDHKHLTTPDLETLIKWVDEQSKQDNVPPEARRQLLNWYTDLQSELNGRSEATAE